MSKSTRILSIILLLFSSQLLSQGTVLRESHQSIHAQNGEIRIYQTAIFSIGYASSCPPLDTFRIIRTGNQISVEVFYDVSGHWPQSGCSRTDTLQSSISACDPCTLVTNTHIIDENDTLPSTPIDTFYNQASDTSYFSILGLFETDKAQSTAAYPNPTSGILTIDAEILSPTKVTLYDLAGTKVETVSLTSNRIDLSEIADGCYFLHLEPLGEDSSLIKVMKR